MWHYVAGNLGRGIASEHQNVALESYNDLHVQCAAENLRAGVATTQPQVYLPIVAARKQTKQTFRMMS